ncbi:hypothetical protein LuPra_04566 [Luteitalea pratensis]|uniref:Uncharacterized protein n=1 Tax=Luteitalea pratensis TaxID=1855912 RepID=A0A143PSL6_LUTPR|nr:hypothetical protein LuPra_04566 [Luteitalea pratensis]
MVSPPSMPFAGRVDRAGLESAGEYATRAYELLRRSRRHCGGGRMAEDPGTDHRNVCQAERGNRRREDEDETTCDRRATVGRGLDGGRQTAAIAMLWAKDDRSMACA